MHTGACARKQKYISTYISLCMKTFLKTGVSIYIYIYMYMYMFYVWYHCFNECSENGINVSWAGKGMRHKDDANCRNTNFNEDMIAIVIIVM